MKFAVALVFSLAIAGAFAQNTVVTGALASVVTLVQNLQNALKPLLTFLGPIGSIVNTLLNTVVLVVQALSGLLSTGGLTSLTDLIAKIGPIINQILAGLGVSG